MPYQRFLTTGGKLEGYDPDWHDVGTRRQAFNPNLGLRNCRGRVIACNNSGVWNEAGAFFGFFVAPAYYQTLGAVWPAWLRLWRCWEISITCGANT